MWLTIQNLGTNADGSNKPGYGDLLWFGLELYDDRYPLPGLTVMADQGTGELIYNIGISNLTAGGLQVGQWQTLAGDLYPYMTNALHTAWTWSVSHPGQSNFLASSTNYGDYKLGGILHGWEVPGLSIVTMQIRNLSVQAYGANFPGPFQCVDNFNRADTTAQTSANSPDRLGAQWTITSGTWAISSNQLIQAGGSASEQTICLNTLQTVSDNTGTNFSLQATTQLNTTNSTSFAGLVFNLQNATNYYALRYNGAGLVQLLASVNGGKTTPLSVADAFTPIVNRPYTLTVCSFAPYYFSLGVVDTVTGTMAYTNASVADPGSTFRNGYGGLYANANTQLMRYDNFSLSVVVGAANSPPVAGPLSMGALSGVPATLQIIGGPQAPTDPDHNPLTVTAVAQGAHGAAVSTDGTNVTYTSASAFTGTDSFNYTVGDGRGGFATNTLTIYVVANGPGQNRLSAAGGPSNGVGALTLKYLGIPLAAYALDSATNLKPPVAWMPVITNTADTSGLLSFTKTPTGSAAFYRVRKR